MTQFIKKGDLPLTDSQLHKCTQALIERDWPAWKRERSIRLNDTEFNVFMEQVALDTTVNRSVNVFNKQLQAYAQATTRLAQYILADGRTEIREMQPTGEVIFDEATMESEEVMHEVVVVSAIEALEPTVEVPEYGDIETAPIIKTIENPDITLDNFERTEAQAVVDATPEAVKLGQ
jgi:hypothetical protein